MSDNLHLPEKSQATRLCAKPCHDCPFRRDIYPYQRERDVLNNIAYVHDPEAVPICHHSAYNMPKEGNAQATVCGGWVLMCMTAGTSHLNHWIFRASKGLFGDKVQKALVKLALSSHLVWQSIQEFAMNAAPMQQDQNTRSDMWILNQPRHTRERGYVRGSKYYRSAATCAAQQRQREMDKEVT